MEAVVDYRPKVAEYNEKITHLHDNIKKLSGSLNVKNFDKVGGIVEKVFNKVQDKLAVDLGTKEAIAFLNKLKEVCAQLKRLEEILISHIKSQEVSVQEVKEEVVQEETVSQEVTPEVPVVEKPLMKTLTPEGQTVTL